MPSALLLLIAQTAPVTLPVDDPMAHFDLAKIKPLAKHDDCNVPQSATNDILVCGKKQDDIAIDDARFRDRPVEARFRILGADSRAVVVERGLPGGISAPAAMLSLNWAF